MTIKKQDAGVWVKANEFPAEPNINLPLRIEGEYFTGYARNYGGGHFWVDARNYPNVHPNNVEWLKPVTGYLLTEDEFRRVYDLSFQEGMRVGRGGKNFEQFLESITNQ